MELQAKKEFHEQRIGGGKLPVSPSAIGKLFADVIPVSVNPLENQFDDDSVELVASAINSSVMDDIDEPGRGVQCSMPTEYQLKPRQEKDNKAKGKDERTRCHPCIQLERGKFELTNQGSAGGKNSSVLM